MTSLYRPVFTDQHSGNVIPAVFCSDLLGKTSINSNVKIVDQSDLPDESSMEWFLKPDLDGEFYSAPICLDYEKSSVSDNDHVAIEVLVYDCHTAKERDPGFNPSEECAEKAIIQKALADWNLGVAPVMLSNVFHPGYWW